MVGAEKCATTKTRSCYGVRVGIRPVISGRSRYEYAARTALGPGEGEGRPGNRCTLEILLNKFR